VAVAASLGLSTLSASACAVPRSCAGGIFTDTSRLGSVEPAAGPRVRRQRLAEIDAARVRASAERITLNLFPDVCAVARRERATDLGRGQVQWEGSVAGAAPGTATLVVDGAVMVGTVRLGRELYEIRYLGQGVHVISDVDASRFPRD
jgi:hypothetical protein